jgi:CDP-paratose 2-epimerase
MLFSDDVVKAGMLAFHHIDIVKGNVYNIGGGSFNTISVREAVLALREMCDELHVTTGPGRKNEDMLFVTDHTRFTKATNWEPEISVQQGMRRIMEWARRNERELQLVYQDYINF